MKLTYLRKVESLDVCLNLLDKIYQQLNNWIVEQENFGDECESLAIIETLEKVQAYIEEQEDACEHLKEFIMIFSKEQINETND